MFSAEFCWQKPTTETSGGSKPASRVGHEKESWYLILFISFAMRIPDSCAC